MRTAKWIVKVVVGTALGLFLAVQSSAQQPADVGGGYPLQLGAAWYPEQWPEARWNADLTLMEEAHIHVVRVGEFAWSRMEPAEGQYDLDWLDRAIQLAGQHHIRVVIGTPTAAPPAWLTKQYPETLRVKEDGRRDEHGNRQQFDWSDPLYRKFGRAIAEKLAVRFGHDPNVIGWQIDNEYANVSFSDEARKQWHAWLQEHYGTLDNLNQRWTTAYWSQTYSSWDQIPIETAQGNPGLLLSWKRFVSDTWRSYQKNQLDVIRAHADKQQFVTTNLMGWFDGFDHYTVSQDLDLASWDDYVGSGHLDVVDNGARHDLTRGFLQKNFWVMETQPGSVNWHAVNTTLDKGEVRAMAWHDVGHGAEAVAYWQWRSALNGQEEYHGALVGPDGLPVPLYDEVRRLGSEFEKAGPTLRGTTPISDVAILYSYNSRWAIDWQRHNQNFDPIQALKSYYGPLQKTVHAVDVVSPSSKLDRYKLVVAPALNVLTDSDAKNLIAYVQHGGHLVLGQRSGMKDGDNTLQTARQPGPLAALLGGKVEQYYALDAPVPFEGSWGAGQSRIWAELLTATAPDTKVLARYGKSNGWLDGQPAVITRKVGDGTITYIGVWLDSSAMKNAVDWMLRESGVEVPRVDLPEGVELTIRKGAGKAVWILVNLSGKPQHIELPERMRSVLAEADVKDVSLESYGVAVLAR